MRTFSDVSAARTGIMACLMEHAGDLSAPQRERVMKLGTSPSPVDQIVKTAEYLYAERDQISPPWRELAGALASYAAENGWHGLGGSDNRGGQIARVMARDNGETPPTGIDFPAEGDEPPALAEFTERPATQADPRA